MALSYEPPELCVWIWQCRQIVQYKKLDLLSNNSSVGAPPTISSVHTDPIPEMFLYRTQENGQRPETQQS